MDNKWIKGIGGALLIIAAVLLKDTIPDVWAFIMTGIGVIANLFGVKQK